MEPNYEAPVGGADAGAGVTAGTPPSAEPTSTPSATPPTGASTGSAQQPAQPPRDGSWIPRERLNEQVQRHQAEVRALQQELERARAPKAPTPPPNAEDDAIRQRLYQLNPNLKALLDLDPAQLKALVEKQPEADAQIQHYWSVVGAGALRQIRGSLEKLYGGKPDPFVQDGVETMFENWLRRNPEAYERYIQQDPSLVTDFLKQYESLALDPIRRQAAVTEQQRALRRANLPTAGPRTSQLGVGQKREKPKTEDELHEQAWEALQTQR